MGKLYLKPELNRQLVQLGVFGDYGSGGDDGGGDVIPTPIRIIERFQLHMD
jgi:hypothetical protein